MKPAITIALSALLSLSFSTEKARAPETIVVKREAKLFGEFDRIVQEQPVRQARCKTYGTVWYRGACWRPERIPS